MTIVSEGRARPGEHGPAEHIVGFYGSDAALLGAVGGFLADGLRDGGAIIVVATASHRRDVDHHLSAHGESSEDLAAAGRYFALDAHSTLEMFLRDGSPDAEMFSSVMEPVVRRAASTGRPVRVFGEMVALLWTDGNIDSAIELETLWNALDVGRPFSLYCGYPASMLDAADMLGGAKRVCDQHSHVVSLTRDRPEAARATGDDLFVQSFVPTVYAPQAVRAFVGQCLETWVLPHLVEPATVIASELATNAVIHARSPFRVAVSKVDLGIEIAVRDGSSDLPVVRAGSPDARGGRGMAVVAGLATQSGFNPGLDGKTVWAIVGAQQT